MPMTTDTKAEIAIVGAAGAFMVWLWLRNRAAGGGTGLENITMGNAPDVIINSGAPLFNVPAPVPGAVLNYTGSPWSLPAPSSVGLGAGQPSSCNCSESGAGGSTFGGNSDLAAWLVQQPAIVDAASRASSFY